MYGFFLRHRVPLIVAFWVAYFGLHDLVNATSVLLEYRRLGIEVDRWEPFVWEGTSGLSFLLLLPAVIAFNRRFAISEARWRRPLLAHLLATVPFSLLHVGIMVGLRKAVYAGMNRSYDFGDLGIELIYEYRKDALTYGWILVVLYVYGYVMRRQQGEARFVADGAEAPPQDLPKRLLVKKLGKEFIVAVDDIDWIEAAGNYVNLHIGERLYPLRETMNGIEGRLDAERFARVHRSAIVNLDRVREIRPLDSGDHQMTLLSGDRVTLSRRYRARLKALFPS